MAEPSQANIDKMWAYARKYAEKSGTSLHPDVSVTRSETAVLYIDDMRDLVHRSALAPVERRWQVMGGEVWLLEAWFSSRRIEWLRG